MSGPDTRASHSPTRLRHHDDTNSQTQATLLDAAMPAYDFTETHARWIGASAASTIAALKAVTAAEIALFGSLVWLRWLPSRLTGGASPISDSRRPAIDLLIRFGFVLLAEDADREIVIGAIGRFWQVRNAPVRLANAEEFARFSEPGYVKSAMNFVVAEERDRRCRLTTETRVLATDVTARRKFARYCRLIAPASGILRRTALVAIARRAERSNPR